MPYYPSEGKAPLYVAGWSWEYFRADKRVVIAGEYVNFEGRLLIDDTPAPGETVALEYFDEDFGWTEWARTETDSDGVARFSVRAPHYLGCRDLPWRVRHVTSGEVSSTVAVAVAFRTRLSVELSRTEVAPGEPVTARGKLEFESSAGRWDPLPGETVKVYVDSWEVGRATTGSDGTWEVTFYAPTVSGTYNVIAEYEGRGLPAGYAAAEAKAVLTPAPGLGRAVAVLAASLALLMLPSG